MKKKQPRKKSDLHKLVIFFFNRPYILLFLISLVLVVSWFSSQQLIASGEEGLFFQNPKISLQLFSSPWYEVVTGMPMPVLLPRISLLLIPYLLTNILSFQPWVAQAIILFLLLCCGLVSTYFLAKLFLRNKSKEAIFLTIAIFYLFNLYSLSQIFGRLLFTGIVLWGYLPLFLLFYVIWVEKRRFVYLILFLASSFVFSYVYGMPSNVIVLWFIPLIYTVISFIRVEDKFKFFLRAIFAVVTWIVANIWWIFPYVRLSQSAFSSVAGSSSSLDSLIGVSQYFPSNQILMLRQSFLFQHTYFGWYTQPWVIWISVIMVLIVFYGVISSRKSKFWVIFLIALIIGWFVSKGTNPPFGKAFFNFIFSQSTALQVFRNSYEKFGIIFLLPYSFFFGVGIENIIARIKIINKLRVLLFVCAVIIFCFVLVWPILTGDVFGAKVSNTRVTVPESYAKANKYINSRGEGKILMLPMLFGDGIKYLWQKGYYQGIEPSEVLFDQPSISKIVRMNIIDTNYAKLYDAFANDKPYSSLLRDMNIRYIILHNDIDQKVSATSTSAAMKIVLRNNNKIKLLKSYGALDIYEFNDQTAKNLFDVPVTGMKMDYKKLSSTHYIIQIYNASKPYKLVFKETFHPFWIATIDKSIVSNHFIAYDYANGWNINKTGTYTIDIHFKLLPW